MRNSIRLILLVLGLAGSCVLAQAQTQTQAPRLQLSIDESTGLPILQQGGADMVKASFNFWGPNWGWTGSNAKVSGNSKQGYQLTLQNKTLDFDMAAEVQPGAHKITWQNTLNARKDIADISGGGMVFKFNLAAFGADMGVPELLPDNAGWRWGQTSGKSLEMRISPALASVYFEMGDKNQLRAFFFGKKIAAGQQSYTMTLSYGDDIDFRPGINERFDGDAPNTWPTDSIAGNALPIDLSFLNANDKPAGKRGRIQAQGDRLVYPDGQEARLWGTNVVAYALFNTPKDLVPQQARRLAAEGYNLVRIHHHDSAWVNPNVFGDSKVKKNTLTLDNASLDKLDWWIKCLKDEGIHVWLDMHVQRAFKRDDGIFAFDEFSKGKEQADLKGYNYVNASIQKAMRTFNEEYLNHVNAYTGAANKDEPAIVALLLTNENDLTRHFGNMLLPNQKVPQHNQLYMDKARVFAEKTGLPVDKVWHSWESGPPKLFLNDLEHRFDTSMIEDLRRFGAKASVVTTSSWGSDPLFSLPALTTGDIIDVHSYGTYGQLEKNPLFAANITDWMAAAHVVGKPLSVSEWNAEPFPTPDRHTLPLFVAARAAHQGWDAMLHYAYAQEALKGAAGTASNWHSYNDPSLLPMLSAAALMYRRGDVRQASSTYVLDLGPDEFFNHEVSPNNATAIRTAAEKGKVLIAMPKSDALPWLQRAPAPSGATTVTDFRQAILPAGAASASSDTGELKHDWSQGIYTIDTPRTQAAMGWIGGTTVTLSDATFQFTTRNVAASVQSLGDQPISKAREILVSLAARSVPQTGNKAPFLVEPIAGRITIKAMPGLKVYRKGPANQESELPASYDGKAYTFMLDGKHPASWIALHH
jgi:hypothetical protein